MKDQILAFFAQGFSKEDIKKTLGCSDDLIESFTSEESFAVELAEARTKIQQERVERYYNKLEEKTLKRLTEDVEMLEPAQLCRVLDTVAKNKVAYRHPANTYQNPTVQQSVTLILPQAAVNQKVILDSNSQVVAIGDRTMASLPLENVKALFADFEANKANKQLKELKNDLSAETSNA